MIYITYLVLGFGLCSGAVTACGGGYDPAGRVVPAFLWRRLRWKRRTYYTIKAVFITLSF